MRRVREMEPEKGLLVAELLLVGTPPWREITKLNGGKEPRSIYLSGTPERMREQFDAQVQNLPDDEIIYLYVVGYETGGRHHHIVSVDRVRDIRYSINGHLNNRHPDLEKNIFSLSFVEDSKNEHVHMHIVSLGNKDTLALRGRQLMAPVFGRLKNLLEYKYDGWGISAYCLHEKSERFMERSFGAKPASRDERIEISLRDYDSVLTSGKLYVGKIAGKSATRVSAPVLSPQGEKGKAMPTAQQKTVLFTMLNGVLRDFMPMVNASLTAAVLKAYPDRDAAFAQRLYQVIQGASGLSPEKKLREFNRRYPQNAVDNTPALAAEAGALQNSLSAQVSLSPAGWQLLELFQSDLTYTISVGHPGDIEEVMKSNPSLSEAQGLLVGTLGHTGEADYDKFSHVERVIQEHPDVKNVFLVFDAPGEIEDSRRIADRLSKQGKRVHVIGMVYPMPASTAKESLKIALRQIGYTGSVNADALRLADQSLQSLSKSLRQAGADAVVSGVSGDLTQIEKLQDRAKEPAADLTEDVRNYLRDYKGSAMTVEKFVVELKKKGPDRVREYLKNNRKAKTDILALLETPAVADGIEGYSVPSLRLYGSLRMQGLLKNREGTGAGASDRPVLGNLYFIDEMKGTELLQFYHPQTGVTHSLRIIPQERGNRAVFCLYACSPCGNIYTGYTEGEFGTNELKATGDISGELIKVIQFVQLHLNAATELNIGGARNIGYLFLMDADKQIILKAGLSLDLYDSGKITSEYGRDRLEVNLIPVTHPEREKPTGSPHTDAQRRLFFRNDYFDPNKNYMGRFPEFFDLVMKGYSGGNRRPGNILELGSGDNPLVARLARKSKVVAIDIGMPVETARKDNVLWVRGDVEKLDGLSKEAKADIAGFLGERSTKRGKAVWSGINTVVLSNILNYVDAKALFAQIAAVFSPGTTVLVQNHVENGAPEVFSSKGVKSNRDVLEAFDPAQFKLKALYGYRELGSKDSTIPRVYDVSEEIKSMTPEEAANSDVVLYLMLERIAAPAGPAARPGSLDRRAAEAVASAL